MHFGKTMEKVKIHDKTFVPYLRTRRNTNLHKSISSKVYEDYKDETPVFIELLNGVIMFSQTFKTLSRKCEVAFVQVSSYHGGLQSTGIVYTKWNLLKR